MNVVKFLKVGYLMHNLFLFYTFFSEQFCPGSHHALVVNCVVPFLSLHYSTGENKTFQVLEFQSVFDTMSLITTKWQKCTQRIHEARSNVGGLYIVFFSLFNYFASQKVKHQTVENGFIIFHERNAVF